MSSPPTGQSSEPTSHIAQPTAHDFFGFDGAFLLKLERLALLSRRPVTGQNPGPRRSTSHGASVEFADFRDYASGDDFRRIDWNAYARLDRLFLRLYRAEQMTTLSLFLDHSSSMSFGEPTKALAAARMAAIFSFVALQNYDRVVVVGWSEKIDHRLPVQAGKRTIPQVWRFIADVMGERSTPSTNHDTTSAALGRNISTTVADRLSGIRGVTDFAALQDYARSHSGPGLAIVLSDFLTDTHWRAGLRALRGRGQEVSIVQILSPEELHPQLRGDWNLRDAETGAEVEVTISPRLLRRYQEELAAYTATIRDFCRRHDMAFVQLASSAAHSSDVLTTLRTVGILQ